MDEPAMSGYADLASLVIPIVAILVFFLVLICKCNEPDEVVQREALRRRAAAALAAHEALAARQAAALLAEQAARPPLQVELLPHFPYAQGRAPAEEPVMCAICLDELRQGQLCSEVPACRHVFREACIRVWVRKVNSCPLCRVRIVPGTAADDMV